MRVATNYQATLDSIHQATPARKPAVKRAKPASPPAIKVVEPKPVPEVKERTEAVIAREFNAAGPFIARRRELWKEYMALRKADLEPQGYEYGIQFAGPYQDLYMSFQDYKTYLNQQNESHRMQRIKREEALEKFGPDSGYVPTVEDFFAEALKKGGPTYSVRALPNLSTSATICHCCGCASVSGSTGHHHRRGFMMWDRGVVKVAGEAKARDVDSQDLSAWQGEEPYIRTLIEDPENIAHLKLYWRDA